MIRPLSRLTLLTLLCTATALAQPATAQWPTHDGAYDIANFHFKDGETIEKLHLHYLTLGKPHRDAAGHT